MDDARNGGDRTWLQGESVVALVGSHGTRVDLPAGISRLPAPLLLSATRFDGSPVGPHLELTLAVLARCGAHVGWCRVLTVVDRRGPTGASGIGGALDAQLGTLRWEHDERVRSLAWEEAGVRVSGRVRRPPLPWVLPQRILKRRGGGPVVVPTRLRGLLHPCVVTVEVDEGERLAELRGRHVGAVVTGLRAASGPARRALPVATPRPVRASGVPEPALRSRVEVHAERTATRWGDLEGVR